MVHLCEMKMLCFELIVIVIISFESVKLLLEYSRWLLMLNKALLP